MSDRFQLKAAVSLTQMEFTFGVSVKKGFDAGLFNFSGWNSRLLKVTFESCEN